MSAAPIVMLAPMAGITDLPFRKLVQRFGVDLVVSEMVASQDIVNSRPGSREKAELGLDQTSTAVQLAGRDPHWMAEAAKIVEADGARTIDINMGCPAKKVTGGQSGSALMRDLELATRMIRATVGAVNVPVTLKCRLGWDDDVLNAPELARIAEGEGVSRLVVHGRTRCQFYKGAANWAAIAPVVQAVSIPVIANGDIVDINSAKSALEQSGAAGVMVGRGAQGKPWLLAQLRAGLAGRQMPPDPQVSQISDMALDHYDDMQAFYGEMMGPRVARKHLGWYMDHTNPPKDLRKAVLTASKPQDVRRLFAQAMEQTAGQAA